MHCNRFPKSVIAILLLPAAILLCRCSKGVSADQEWEVTGILSPNGLGDLSYNDKTYLGLCYMRDVLKCHVETCSPESFEEAEKSVNQWLSLAPESNVHRLLVLCDSKYIDLVKRNGWKNSAGKDILLCDVCDTTVDVYTRSVLLYGACYAIGRLTGPVNHSTGRRTALLLANDEDWAVGEGAAGFLEGAGEASVDVDRYCVYDAASRGYNVPDSVYHLCYKIAPTTGFIMPLAGSSNNGVYRYDRDNRPDTLWTCAVDEFFDTLPYQSCFCVEKESDSMLLNFANAWKNNVQAPLHAVYGLESGLESFHTFRAAFEREWDEDVQAITDKAVAKENDRYRGYTILDGDE